VRIEDDVLVTATGNRVLSAKITKTVREIEQIMRDAN
jgi:Xaa-Pro aminopeptidase